MKYFEVKCNKYRKRFKLRKTCVRKFKLTWKVDKHVILYTIDIVKYNDEYSSLYHFNLSL